MIITYLVFGDEHSNYCQAFFSILTFLDQKKDNDSIIVVTDSPKMFNLFKNRVSTLTIDEKTLNTWKGDYNLFFRIKIKSIELVSEKFKDEHILYLDSDTFLFGDLEKIRDHLDENQNLMHTNEGRISEASSKTPRVMWNILKNKKYSDIKINSNTCMWNAGCIGISKANTFLIDKVLKICDLMCSENVRKGLIEQFSFSIVLNNYSKLVPLEKIIGHYWGNKETWNREILILISEFYLKNLSVEQQIEEIKDYNFQKNPVRIKKPNTRLRLEKILSFIFPDKVKD